MRIGGADNHGFSRARRWFRWAAADRPGPVEMLLGFERYHPVLVRAEALWFLGVASITLGGLLLPRPEMPNVHTTLVYVLIIGIIPVLGLLIAKPHLLAPGERSSALLMVAVAALFVVSHRLGPSLQTSAVVTTSSGVMALVLHNRRTGLLIGLELAIGHGVLYAVQDGYPAPVLRWLVVTGAGLATAIVLTWMVDLVERLAEEAQASRDAAAAGAQELAVAHAELARLNEQLAQKVEVQEGEIGSLSRLRRFLDPQIADAVLRDAGEAMLQPHRARIAALFVDLRGFTAFSATCSPEDVMEVLDEYFSVLAELVEASGATVGAFAGDGLMAFFGDPVPHADPAAAAISMGVGIRASLSEAADGWRRRGFALGYGVGIAYGYATLGTIGLGARAEYTAHGPVVNLAARLCGVAVDTEILVDARAYEEVADRLEADRRTVELKGITGAVEAHNVLAWRG